MASAPRLSFQYARTSERRTIGSLGKREESSSRAEVPARAAARSSTVVGEPETSRRSSAAGSGSEGSCSAAGAGRSRRNRRRRGLRLVAHVGGADEQDQKEHDADRAHDADQRDAPHGRGKLDGDAASGREKAGSIERRAGQAGVLDDRMLGLR